MSHPIRVSLGGVLCALLASGGAAHAQDDEAELRRIKTQEWPRLYREQDVAGLDRLLHPSFQSIDAQGKRSTKAEELAYVKANRPSYRSFEYVIERLDIYPQGVAIVDGIGRIRQTDCDGFTYRSSNVLLKDAGRWRPVGSHISGVTEERSDSAGCKLHAVQPAD